MGSGGTTKLYSVDMQFDSTLDSLVDGGTSVEIYATGLTTLTGAVGGIARFVNLRSNAGGTTVINGGVVKTTGRQSYYDAIILGANTVLTAGSDNVNFLSTINGAFTLTVNCVGMTYLGGAVGGTTALTGPDHRRRREHLHQRRNGDDHRPASSTATR